jgi:drug/metabolite transporter (DMT)-like permease
MWGFIWDVLMGVLTAFALIMVRSLSRSESPGAIAFYFVIASMIGGIATVPFGWAMPDEVCRLNPHIGGSLWRLSDQKGRRCPIGGLERTRTSDRLFREFAS